MFSIRESAKLSPQVRAQGIIVVLVTGRILADLRRVAGELQFVDAVVAENEAVIEFPDSGYSRVVGQSPPPAPLNELRREGIPFSAGQSILDSHADMAPRILAILQRLELPLVLAFNRSRVMVLPQAISKATRVVLQALSILRLSSHNTVAIKIANVQATESSENHTGQLALRIDF